MRYRFADCELDVDRREFHRGGRAVPVEPQVFDLLRYFVEHSGIALSKDQIFDAIWQGRIVSDTTLISRIKSARNAIGDTGHDQRMIKTLHGHGFRFMSEVTVLGPVAQPFGRAAEQHPERDLRPSLIVRPLRVRRFPDLEPVAEGITNELVRLLSRLRWLKVVAGEFCPSPEHPAPNAPDAGRAATRRYILDGSIERLGTQFRVNVRLIDAADGVQIWCERYDRNLPEAFEVQDELAQVIAGTLEPELARIEAQAAACAPADHRTAWDLCLQGHAQLFRFTPDGFAEASRLFSCAIAIDARLGRAYAGQAYIALQQAHYGHLECRPANLEIALTLAHHAVETDERDVFGYFTRARVHAVKHEIHDAETALQKALQISPSFAQAHFALGFLKVSIGRPIDAIAAFQRFTTLSPWDPLAWSSDNLCALSHFGLGDLAKAEFHARRAVGQPHATRWAFATLTAVLGAGRRPEAARARDRLLKRQPDYTVAIARNDFFFIEDADLEARYLAGLRAAGVPEG